MSPPSFIVEPARSPRHHPVGHAPTRPTASLRRFTSTLHLWHLLSLDAPTVATLWTALFAHAFAVRLPPATLPAMFLAVWLLYAADRLLDARRLPSSTRLVKSAAVELESRHLFHHAHRRAFLTALALVATALALLIPHLSPAAIRLDLLLGTLLLTYFFLIHAPRRTDTLYSPEIRGGTPRSLSTGAPAKAGSRLPKEIAVGLFFSVATILPTAADHPTLRPALALIAILFAALCSLNCIAIYRWEHPFPSRQPHTLTRLGVAYLSPALTTLLLLAFVLAPLSPASLPLLAIALAASFLLVLHRLRHRCSALTLRSLADLALTTPILFLLRR